jgi:hypothetical protein
MSEAAYPRALAGAFAWPLRHPTRLYLLSGFGLLLGTLRVFPWVAPGRYAAAGFVFFCGAAVSWLFAIVRRTTHPEDRRPETVERELDLGDAWSDLLQALAAAAAAYLPLAGFVAYALLHDGRPFQDSDFRVALGALGVAGTIYLPMALLLLGFSGRGAAAFNLPLGLRSMGRLGADYGLCVAYFLAAAALSAALELAWVRFTPLLGVQGWAARTSTSLIELYLAAVGMRALGLLYVAKGESLGWVSRPPT